LLRRSMGDAGYATFFLAEFDKTTHALTYVNAGHNPPMLLSGGTASREEAAERFVAPKPLRSSPTTMVRTTAVGVSLLEKPVVSLLPTGGPIIGTFLNEPYEQETIQLQRGDTLVAYTDGVTEALNLAGKEFGEDQLRSVLVDSQRLPARETGKKIIAEVSDWQGEAPQHDDITLVVVKIK
jgi:sigma-B regulation protein RsbU (phosphoserine phosphatase)